MENEIYINVIESGKSERSDTKNGREEPSDGPKTMWKNEWIELCNLWNEMNEGKNHVRNIHLHGITGNHGLEGSKKE